MYTTTLLYLLQGLLLLIFSTIGIIKEKTYILHYLLSYTYITRILLLYFNTY